MIRGLIELVLHAALMLAIAPIAGGIITIVAARLQERRGPHLLQPWRDLIRLVRKQPVATADVSFVHDAAPLLYFATICTAIALVPSFALNMAGAPAADLLVIAGLLALGQASLALAALDSGTGFGGMAASRVMQLAIFAEPAMLMVILPLGLLAGTTNLDAIAGFLHSNTPHPTLPLVLVIAALTLIALVESSQTSTPNPTAHMATTMRWQALSLEYSGWHLAALELGDHLRRLLWFSLLILILAPIGIAGPIGNPVIWPAIWGIGIFAWVGKILVLCSCLGAFEAFGLGPRAARRPAFLGGAIMCGLLAALYLFAGTGWA